MNKYFVFYGLKIDDVDLLAVKEEIEVIYKKAVPEDRQIDFLGGEKTRLLSMLSDATCNCVYLTRLPSITLCREFGTAKFDVDCCLAFPICLFSLREFDCEEEALLYKQKIEHEVSNCKGSFLEEIISCYKDCSDWFIKFLELGHKETEFMEAHKPAVHLFGPNK